MVLGVSYLRVLAQRPTGCCSASLKNDTNMDSLIPPFWKNPPPDFFELSGQESYRAPKHILKVSACFSKCPGQILICLYYTLSSHLVIDIPRLLFPLISPSITLSSHLVLGLPHLLFPLISPSITLSSHLVLGLPRLLFHSSP